MEQKNQIVILLVENTGKMELQAVALLILKQAQTKAVSIITKQLNQ